MCGNQFNEINGVNTHNKYMHGTIKVISMRESLAYEQKYA